MESVNFRSGYILLISIVVIGAISSAILSSLLLLGISANQVSHSVENSKQALALSQACAEYTLMKLRESPNFSGNEIFDLDGGTCKIKSLMGTGNFDRQICTEGVAGEMTRRIEISVSQILPKTVIYSWQEVPSFSLCN